MLCTKGLIDFRNFFLYLPFMNENEVTTKDLESLEKGLRALADACAMARDEMSKKQIEVLETTNWKTCQKGIVFVQNFVGGAHANLALKVANSHLKPIFSDGVERALQVAEEALEVKRQSKKKAPPKR